MSIDDRVPDHDELRRLATQRVRRGRLIGFGLALTAFVLPAAVLAAAGGPGKPVAVLFVPALIGALVLVVTFTVVGRSEGGPQLVAGADGQTRRAVQRALRTGVPADARIDALTRDTAARTARRGWLVWLYIPFVLVQWAILVSRIGNGEGADRIALSVAVTAMFSLLLVVQVIAWRRSRRYLARPPSSGVAGDGEGHAS